MVLAGVTVAFPQTPLDVDIELYYSGGWQNINADTFHRDAAPITITRGRTAEGRNCDPGKMTLKLNNRDGKYSPRNPNSPLFGLIGRNTLIRVSVTYDSVTYVRFVGEIPSWPSRWDVSGRDVWVEIEAAGILRRLGQGSKPLKPALDLAIMADSPVAYWRMDDPGGGFASSLPSGGTPLSEVAIPAGDGLLYGAVAAPPGGSGNGMADFAAGAFVTTHPSLPVAAPWTAVFSIKRPTDGTADGVGIVNVYFNVDGVETSAAFGVTEDTEVSARDWYQITIEGAQNGANWEIHRWRNGLDKGITYSGAGTLGAFTGATASVDGLLGISEVSVGYLAIYSGVGVVDAQVHSDALQAYAGMLADDRFEAICARAGIPYLTIGGSEREMSAQRLSTVLQALRDVEATDQGFLFERRDVLGLAYRTNSSRYHQTAIALDYDVGHISDPFQPEPDDRNVANDREVKSRDGVSARRELTSGPLSIQDPPDGVGRYDDTVTVDVLDYSELENIASWRLHVGTWDAERYPRVRVDLSAASNASLIPQIAAADSGDLITIDNLPAWLPPEPAELLIEGYREVIGFFDWDFVFNCSPAGPYNVVGGWGLMAHELHTAMDTSTTSADIATTSTTQPLLGTTALGSGHGLAVNGEEMQVTAVADSLVTYGAAGTAAHAVNANVTPGIPASVATGNLLLIYASIRNSGTGVPNTPSGYTRLAVFPASANTQIFAKIAASGAEAAPTISFSGGAANQDTSAQMIRLAGKWHSTGNILVGSAHCLNASAQNITYPGLAKPAADNCIILYIGWKQDNWTGVAAIAGATEIGEPSTATGDNQGLVWDYVIQTTAAAITSGVFTVTAGTTAISRGAVMALRCDYQTATVTRSTNGITASHAAGDDVTATRPMRWALI
jgi:hypothetical protein